MIGKVILGMVVSITCGALAFAFTAGGKVTEACFFGGLTFAGLILAILIGVYIILKELEELKS